MLLQNCLIYIFPSASLRAGIHPRGKPRGILPGNIKIKNMKLISSTIKSGAGFTLVEIMVGIGILAVILSLGLVLSMDFYKNYALRYEQNLVVGILQKARSQAMANIDQINHGVCLSGSNYSAFGGDTCISGVIFPKATAVNVSWPTPVVFKQLDGTCTTCLSGPAKVTLTGQGKTADITIYDNGRIDW